MANESGDAEEGLFTLDPEDQAAVEATFGAEGEVPGAEEQAQAQTQEHAQGQDGSAADRPKVRMFSLSFFPLPHVPSHSFPRC